MLYHIISYHIIVYYTIIRLIAYYIISVLHPPSELLQLLQLLELLLPNRC